MKDPAEEARRRYRKGYEHISWSNTPRPAHQGGVRQLLTAPLGEVIDLTPDEWPGLQGSRERMNGETVLLLRPKFISEEMMRNA